MAVDQPFRFPAAFTFVLRAFSTLEGLGKALDPDYSFAVVAQPFGEELLNLQVRPFLCSFVWLQRACTPADCPRWWDQGCFAADRGAASCDVADSMLLLLLRLRSCLAVSLSH